MDIVDRALRRGRRKAEDRPSMTVPSPVVIDDVASMWVTRMHRPRLGPVTVRYPIGHATPFAGKRPTRWWQRGPSMWALVTPGDAGEEGTKDQQAAALVLQEHLVGSPGVKSLSLCTVAEPGASSPTLPWSLLLEANADRDLVSALHPLLEPETQWSSVSSASALAAGGVGSSQDMSGACIQVGNVPGSGAEVKWDVFSPRPSAHCIVGDDIHGHPVALLKRRWEARGVDVQGDFSSGEAYRFLREAHFRHLSPAAEGEQQVVVLDSTRDMDAQEWDLLPRCVDLAARKGVALVVVCDHARLPEPGIRWESGMVLGGAGKYTEDACEAVDIAPTPARKVFLQEGARGALMRDAHGRVAPVVIQ